ncbi:pimeloyl-ACP methyl ester carboxylesterase [Lutibacter sp. Hel_I_33_5]|uniref:alpha/beta fold hydrolase n=1 Tax=Lutibacter sp. Hel_I_33_5 TaxID=1566289 RepID=UPI0011A836E9|nr:alpha/beta fold hydrolase [Lutibacter sp. Hel_I_33_5]TVZ55945.1 pimeloyl-ACP methyl ester carboxylesterase [Lutibacter sp. Hel_I_33_5]
MEILHSRILGEGKPLLILHGYFGMGDNWKTLGSKFAEDYQVHLIDQRNHGRSFHSDEFNYDVLVDDLYNYIKHHELENVHLLGHSMGGKTAMLFAVTYPELLDKLLIADISPRAYKPHHNEILAGLNSIDFSLQNSRKLVDEKLSELIPIFGVRQFLLKNVYWREKGQLDFRFNLESLTKNNLEIGAKLPDETIFNSETLFLKGEKSGYITEAEKPIIEKHFPNAKIVGITNSGHWLHAENPIDFYNQVLDFLK